MLGLGFWEIVLIGLVVLIVIGPERLPDFAKSVARFINEMKRTVGDLKTTFDEEKDIFKENIDQLQKLKQEIEALPKSAEHLLDHNGSETDPGSVDHSHYDHEHYHHDHQPNEDHPQFEEQLELMDPHRSTAHEDLKHDQDSDHASSNHDPKKDS